MSIKVTCIGCGKTLKAPDEAAGSRVRCPACKTVVQVPETTLGGSLLDSAPGQGRQRDPQALPADDSLLDPVPLQDHEAPPQEESSPLGDIFGSSETAGEEQGGYELSEPAAAGPKGADAGEPRRPCPMCGEMIPVKALKCRFCGEVFDPALKKRMPGPQGATVPTHLGTAIVVTLFCCLPAGIVAIVYAAQVNSKLAAGDYEGAVAASNSAKTWSWASFGLGLGLMAVYFVAGIIGAASEM